MTRSWRWLLALPLIALGSPASAQTVELDPKVLVHKLPDQLKWRDPTGAAGMNQAVLQGDPSTTGLYVVLNRFKPGNFSRPHFHPNDRYITVDRRAPGGSRPATRSTRTRMLPMPAGSFVIHFGKEVHWDGAKDEEAWVLIVGEGPATLTPGSRRRSNRTCRSATESWRRSAIRR